MGFSKQPKETEDPVLSQEDNIASPSPSLEHASVKDLMGALTQLFYKLAR